MWKKNVTKKTGDKKSLKGRAGVAKEKENFGVREGVLWKEIWVEEK